MAHTGSKRERTGGKTAGRANPFRVLGRKPFPWPDKTAKGGSRERPAFFPENHRNRRIEKTPPTTTPREKEKEKPQSGNLREDWRWSGNTEDNIVTTGTIYYDNSSKGWMNGKRVFKACYRAEIMIGGRRYRHRSKDRQECEDWLRAVKHGKIRPTDNKADWLRMEQKKDEGVRIDEIIVSQAEESVLLYDYHQTGDIAPINDYLVRRLLPHMAYYCAHTLRFGKERTVTASRQAAALLLTRITSGKPVLNFTGSCKRMLRVYKHRGDFFFYEKAPEQVKLMVDGMNLDALAEVWKVTKDRRL